jgi:hypothetical protein
MISPAAIGALVIAIPTIFVAYVAFFWRRRPIFWFVVALLAVGLGYLGSTGALHEIGAMVWSEAEMIEQGR